MNIDLLKNSVMQLITPCYVFDIEMFAERIHRIQDYLGDRVDVCYAMKANPFLGGVVENIKIEVCSPGEFAICERSGIKPEQIVLSGVNKEANEICRVMKLYGDRITYTVESLGQYELLSKVAVENNLSIQILLRLTSGNQFGMDTVTISEVIADREHHPEMQIKGLQLYSGTQKKKLSKIQKELNRLDDFMTELYEKYGFVAEELEYGPGLYVPYFLDEERELTEDLKTVLTEFRGMMENLKYQGHITLEMGRYLASSCGYYYTSIVDEKKNRGQSYGIADGGIHQLNYYGQMMAMKVPHYSQISIEGEVLMVDGKTDKLENTADNLIEQVTLCGSLCTVNDILVRSMALCTPLKDTKVVFENCGAYSVTEGMALFLSRDLPRVYLYQDGEFVMVRDRVESNSWNAE